MSHETLILIIDVDFILYTHAQISIHTSNIYTKTHACTHNNACAHTRTRTHARTHAKQNTHTYAQQKTRLSISLHNRCQLQQMRQGHCTGSHWHGQRWFIRLRLFHGRGCEQRALSGLQQVDVQKGLVHQLSLRNSGWWHDHVHILSGGSHKNRAKALPGDALPFPFLCF
jgi:hypothetical protein